MVPEIWCAMDGQMDELMDRKSDIKRWVPYLKNIYQTFFKIRIHFMQGRRVNVSHEFARKKYQKKVKRILEGCLKNKGNYQLQTQSHLDLMSKVNFLQAKIPESSYARKENVYIQIFITPTLTDIKLRNISGFQYLVDSPQVKCSTKSVVNLVQKTLYTGSLTNCQTSEDLGS